jgi:hypothetical protein
LEDIKKASGAELKPVEVNASALIEAILGEKY